MTILAGFSSSRQGRAPLNLAAQISRNTGDKIIATAIVERPGDRTVTRSTTSTSSTSPRRLRDHLGAWSACCRPISTYRLLSINRPLSQEV